MLKKKEFKCTVCGNTYDVSMASDNTFNKCDGCDPSKLIRVGIESLLKEKSRENEDKAIKEIDDLIKKLSGDKKNADIAHDKV